MDRNEILERVAPDGNWKMVEAEFAGKDADAIKATLYQMFPTEDNVDLAQAILRELHKSVDMLYVCSKCGRTEALEVAQKTGWLIHQRAGASEGHLIIRCTEHVTGHALRLAGLPQQTGSTRIADNLERGLYVEYGNGYTAVASELDMDEGGVKYFLHFHQGRLPAFNSLEFETIPALIAEMRKVQSDLRRWRLVELEA